MNKTPLDYYSQELKKYQDFDIVLRKKIRIISLLRFAVFIGLIVSLFYANSLGWLTGTALCGVLLTSFLYLIKVHINAGKEKKRNSILCSFCESELKALNHEFSQFNSGEVFENPDHDFTYDLDIFGKGSLFQYLNRTSTISGEKKLAQWIQNPSLNKTEIEQKQQAIQEIAGLREWRINFLSWGKMFEESGQQHQEVEQWAVKKFQFKNARITAVLIIALPTITILSFAAIAFGWNYNIAYILVLLQWFSMYFYRKQIKEYFRFFGKKALLIEKYKTLLKEIEEQTFQSIWLIKQQKLTASPESACKTIHKLGKLVRQFEYRQNVLVGFVLNSVFMWDIRCVYKLYEWQSKNKTKLLDWLTAIENTDAIISLANFADNHSDYAYPEINSDIVPLEGQNLGHPLLHPEKRVCSSLTIDKQPKVIIVTGANMAGKSTFLRAVGVNLVLAGIGAPVCAKKFGFTPMALYTNMRTTDSLFKDESYFFAELKRLGQMLERLRNGEHLFVILDEMLKGTNSVDKLNGSRELVKKMVQHNAVALVATHDLKLAELENQLEEVVNKCFEIHIENDELTFDYTLTDGVTESMNATFLMKKMGII